MSTTPQQVAGSRESESRNRFRVQRLGFYHTIQVSALHVSEMKRKLMMMMMISVWGLARVQKLVSDSWFGVEGELVQELIWGSAFGV